MIAVVLAAAASGGDGRSRNKSLAPPGVLVAAGVVGIVVVLALAALLLFGVRGPGDEAVPPATTLAPAAGEGAKVQGPSGPSERGAQGPSGPSERGAQGPATTLPRVQVDPGPPLAIVAVRAADPDRFAPYEVVDALQPGAVVRIRATGFDPFEDGRVELCVSEVGHLPGCTPPFPVQMDDGRAEFQYQLRDSFAPGACRVGGPTCTLRVSGVKSGRQGSIQTVFGGRVEVGRVALEPASGIVDGQQVTVSVVGFPAGATLLATVCAPPGGYDPRRCRADDEAARFRVGPAGSGRTNLVLTTGDIGTDRVPCGPRRACGVTVVSDAGFVSSATGPISFSLGPGAGYDPKRLAAGLVVAALLVASALVLIGRTDWRAPTEAATPAVDDADLETGLSLDELFGTDEELDAKDPVGF